MKKTIPFELFEPNQYIYFDILRLAEFEKALGMSIIEIVKRQEAGLNFCLTALPIVLKHHYFKATPLFFAEKIEEYLEKGGSLEEIALPIIKAIFASGVFGKEVNQQVNGDMEVTQEQTEKK